MVISWLFSINAFFNGKLCIQIVKESYNLTFIVFINSDILGGSKFVQNCVRLYHVQRVYYNVLFLILISTTCN
jgi:hypothetical protein